MNTREAALIRKRYQYRRLVLSGKISLPYQSAARLIGPDCAYHLYSKRKKDAPQDGGDAHTAVPE